MNRKIVELNDYYKYNILFRHYNSVIPIIRTYSFKIKSLCVKDEYDNLYLSNLTNIKTELKLKLNLPHNTTILNNSSFIGNINDIKISLEIITDISYIRKLKIDKLLN